jgi:hypothetical protein
MDEKPDFLFSMRGREATTAIADWWRERWLSRRIEQDRILDEVAAHTLVRPVSHGARVELPLETVGQRALFDDSISE